MEVAHGVDEHHHVAPGHDADVLIRWGDPVVPGAPAFDPANQSAAAQAMQFGYNNDYIGFLPLPAGSGGSIRGLLCVNHEYTNEELMFPGLGRQDDRRFGGMTRVLVDIEMAAHGVSIIEVGRADAGGKWRTVPESAFNRRITATTPMRLAGPAGGHARMRTREHPSGRHASGTINNCAGGVTPWGTYLTAEENFNGYFAGALEPSDPEHDNHRRYGVPGGWYAWSRHYDRFDLRAEPNEPNRFGWVVEIDPHDPGSIPVKRTALGRFKHEGAEPVVNRDGRVVVYMGDDEAFEHVYKYVSDGRYDPTRRAANSRLLDHGTLYVARFEPDGTVRWLPLVHGTGPLTRENRFATQADVLIETRRAAGLLGATPMDRPEDVEPDPRAGRVYVMLTGNSARRPAAVDPANPRADNAFGHILEVMPPDGDHAALEARWDVLVRCGDPARPEVGARWGAGTSRHGWFAAPDNAAVDHRGNLWVCTDQGSRWPRTGTADGVWWLGTAGAARGVGRMLFRAPVGAEVCGPRFTPDDATLFLSVQHPAADGVKGFAGFARRSTYEDPATRWPDFRSDMPVRPAVVAVTRRDRRPIGS